MKFLFLLNVALAGFPLSLRADMVTLRSNITYYGKIISLTNEQIALKAEFPNHEVHTLTFERSQLARIEFDDQTWNEGEPPAALAVHHGTPPNINNPPSPLKDTLVLDGGQKQSCSGVIIDDQSIKCGKVTYNRIDRIVWRIYFSAE